MHTKASRPAHRPRRLTQTDVEALCGRLAGQSTTQIARRQGVHRNTAHYRVQKAKSLLGINDEIHREVLREKIVPETLDLWIRGLITCLKWGDPSVVNTYARGMGIYSREVSVDTNPRLKSPEELAVRARELFEKAAAREKRLQLAGKDSVPTNIV